MAGIYAEKFLELVRGHRDSPLLFNPYVEEDLAFDVEGAAGLRCQNLRSYLECFEESPEVMLVGEAPGPRGARYSGLAFTSEHQLVKGEVPFSGVRTSRVEAFVKPREEISARTVWGETRGAFPRVFLWNCIPFHPYPEGKPMGIRNPSRREIVAHQGLLEGVLDLVRPGRVVAVGRSAESSLTGLGVECSRVRHPSYGGTKEFQSGIRGLLGLPDPVSSLSGWVSGD